MSDAPGADGPRATRPAVARETAPTDRRAPTRGRGGRASPGAAGTGGDRGGSPGNRALGRMLGAPASGAVGAARRQAAIRHFADAGTRGTHGRLPHFARIQAAFGRYDASGIRAHTGGAAQQATRSMGVSAYATGRDVVFGGTPSLFMAAHEAAHVMQQRAGVHFWGGGERGRAEREADAVARRVVEGRSAEALIDGMSRRAGPVGPPAPHGAPVQFWGEPDHYILNQAAGQVAIKHLAGLDHIEDKDYLAKSRGDLIGKGRTKTHDGGRIVDSDTPYETFKLRTDTGGILTYGGAGRFAGDLAPTTLGTPTRGKSMMGWAAKARSQGDDYINLSMMDFTEYGLMATNANHFFPLAGVEYRRQHQTARQKMWMACAMRDSATSSKEKKAALSLAREALMFEGFASHFLADSFAAGHLSPHALGRIDSPDKKATTGARVNTWHDILNGLPDGVPTTLGRFHGDYTMDGHDLKYISEVIAQSLLEVAVPWYTGKGYSGNVALPRPDVGQIMADPVVGPIWAQMCADYEPDLERLLKVKRREGKHSLSKYAIYKTTADSQISHDEVMPELSTSVFADGKVPEIDYETETDPEKLGLKVLTIASALRHLLGFRGGWQIHAGVTQKFEPTSLRERTDFKYRIDLQSDNPLKHATDATPPLIPLLGSLSTWLEKWASAAPPLTEAKEFREIRTTLGLLASTLYEDFKDTGDKEKPALRRKALIDLDGVIDKFASKGLTVPDVDRGFVQQGPKSLVSSTDYVPSSSGLPIRMVARQALALMTGAPSEEKRAVGEMLFAASQALSMICADPRPVDDAEHARLYDMVIDVLVRANLFFTARVRLESPLKKHHLAAMDYFAGLVAKVDRLEKHGDLSLTKSGTGVKESTRESQRREILAQLVLDVAPMFELDAAQLYESTGRRISTE